MTTGNLTPHDVMHRAAIAHAALLASDYTGDERKGVLAGKELERLARIDFSATNAGTHFVDSLVNDGIEVAWRSPPWRMRQNTLSMWGRRLDEQLGSARSESEAEAMIDDLSLALVDIASSFHLAEMQSRSSWWQRVIRNLKPALFTVAISAAFVRVKATWKRGSVD